MNRKALFISEVKISYAEAKAKFWTLNKAITIKKKVDLHRMKYLFIILIATSIILQSFSKAILLVNFQINKEYIVKNLCVQKEVEDNCCQGSCHLKKQLEEEEKQEPLALPNLKNIRDFQAFCQSSTSIQFNPLIFLKREFIPFETSKVSGASFSIFHPPKA